MLRQRGQALPLGLAFIMFSALLGIVLFNTGQLSSEKSRAANAADASIYSGLIWQARALNFQAYTNRAMVANQVTVGQVVSITSWSTYAKITAINLDNTIGWFPPAKAFTEAFEQITTTIAEVVEQVAEVAIPVLDMVNKVLSEAQSAVYMGTFAITPEIVKKVAVTNDPRYHVESTYAVAGLARNALQWKDFSRRYNSEDDEILRKEDMIIKSRDKFTRDRSWQLGMGSGWFYVTPLNRFMLVKEGETRLIRKENQSQDDDGFMTSASGRQWEWKAKDTMSFHVSNYSCGWSGCGWDNNEVPLGWGGAYVPDDSECEGEDNGDDFWANYNCSRWAKWNVQGESMVNNNVNYFTGSDSNVKINAEYNGLQAYFDLRDLSAANQDPRLILRTEINVNDETLRTSSNLEGIGSAGSTTDKLRNGIGKGMFRADDEAAAGKLASVSSGEVYYKRPGKEVVSVYQQKYSYTNPPDRVQKEHRKNYTEYANLFNPYWEVRLIDTPKEEKMAAWLIKEPGFATTAAGAVPKGIEHYVEDQQTEIQQLQSTKDELVSQLDDLTDEEAIQLVEQELSSIETQLQSMQAQLGNAAASSLPFSVSTIQTASNIAGGLGSMSDNLATLNSLQSFQGDVLDGFKDKLKSVMEDALKNMLSRYASSNSEFAQQATEYYEKAQDIYQDVVAIQNQIQGEVDRIQSEFNQLQAEYEAITEDVAQQFQAIEEGLRENFQVEIQPLQDRLTELTGNLSQNNLTQQAKDLLQSEIDDVRLQITEQEAQFKQEMRDELDRLTANATQAVSQELDAAKQELANLNNMQLENPLANEQLQNISNGYANLGTGDLAAESTTTGAVK